MDAYWRAANYLLVGQIGNSKDNPLLERPLTIDDVKPRLSLPLDGGCGPKHTE